MFERLSISDVNLPTEKLPLHGALATIIIHIGHQYNENLMKAISIAGHACSSNGDLEELIK